MRDAKVFLKIYLRSRYHQVCIKEEDIYKTTFRNYYHHYEFIGVPFYLTNSPSTFMCLMNNIFNKYLDKFVLVFFYDIIVYSQNEANHERHLKLVLKLLRDQNIYAKLNKCSFYHGRVQYLGHIIFEKGITMDLEKIAAIS